MAVLIIKKQGQPYHQLNLEPGRSYTAGRKADSDIVLDAEKAISREHLKIKLEGSVLTVECISKLANMTVRGAPVLSVELNHSDEFSVGPFDFSFMTEMAETHAIQNSKIATFSPEDKTVIQKASLSALVKIVNADGDSLHQFKLEGRDRWIAGRDAGADILISDHRVSRKQFEIRKVDQRYEISDLASVNGTYINEKLLESQQTITLKSGDMIRVLEHQMVFEVHDPHFFSKVENLAPMVIEQPEPSGSYNLENYEEEQSSPLMIGAPAQNQYYDPSQNVFAAPEAATSPADERTKKIRMLIGAIAVVGGVLYMMGGDDTSNTRPSAQAPAGADPLSGLTAQQKTEYRQSLELSKRYFMEGNYSLSLSEVEDLIKSYKVVDPEAEKLKNTAYAAIETQKQLVKQEKEEKDRQVMEAKIEVATNECSKNLEKFQTEEQLDGCLLEALQLNPAHPLILELKAQFQSLTADRLVKKEQQAEINKRIQQLRNLYEKAKKTESEGDYIATIDAYNAVISSKLPDPGNLKKTSQTRLKKLKVEMATKIKQFEKEAEQHKAAQNLKQAVLTLRSAIQIDPTREDLKELADSIKNDLRKNMMVYYQEGVLEESFGNVDGGDNRAGAKEKWKKILDTDLPDGEYYKKAYIKLKKYGAQ
jgi:pSer/pThr/pTyr-binding forkhead associated (FHA) protein